jgi:hypothetical protein
MIATSKSVQLIFKFFGKKCLKKNATTNDTWPISVKIPAVKRCLIIKEVFPLQI